MIERHKLYDSQLLLDYLLRVNEIISHREPARWAEMVGKEEGQYVSTRNSHAVHVTMVTLFRLGGGGGSWLSKVRGALLVQMKTQGAHCHD